MKRYENRTDASGKQERERENSITNSWINWFIFLRNTYIILFVWANSTYLFLYVFIYLFSRSFVEVQRYVSGNQLSQYRERIPNENFIDIYQH